MPRLCPVRRELLYQKRTDSDTQSDGVDVHYSDKNDFENTEKSDVSNGKTKKSEKKKILMKKIKYLKNRPFFGPPWTLIDFLKHSIFKNHGNFNLKG